MDKSLLLHLLLSSFSTYKYLSCCKKFWFSRFSVQKINWSRFFCAQWVKLVFHWNMTFDINFRDIKCPDISANVKMSFSIPTFQQMSAQVLPWSPSAFPALASARPQDGQPSKEGILRNDWGIDWSYWLKRQQNIQRYTSHFLILAFYHRIFLFGGKIEQNWIQGLTSCALACLCAHLRLSAFKATVKFRVFFNKQRIQNIINRR